MRPPRLDLEALYAVPCRFGCDDPVVAIVHVPEGCVCWRDPLQALCAHHLMKAQSSGPIIIVADYRVALTLKGNDMGSSAYAASVKAYSVSVDKFRSTVKQRLGDAVRAIRAGKNAVAELEQATKDIDAAAEQVPAPPAEPTEA